MYVISGSSFDFHDLRINGSAPVLVQRLCRAHEELLWGLEGDACVQGKLQVSRRKVLEKSQEQIRCQIRSRPKPATKATMRKQGAAGCSLGLSLLFRCQPHLRKTDGCLPWSVSGSMAEIVETRGSIIKQIRVPSMLQPQQTLTSLL